MLNSCYRAARILCMLFLLEEANKRDELFERRQGVRIRDLGLFKTNRDYTHAFRLTKSLITMLEYDLGPLLPTKKRRDGLSHHTKVPT